MKPKMKQNAVKIIQKLSKLNPKRFKPEVERRVLEIAIENTKLELEKRGLSASDISEKQLEILVHDEQKKIWSSFQTRSITVLLALLGIQSF